MKKLFAALTALILVISISTAAMAACPTQGTGGKSGTYTVSNVSNADLSQILDSVLSQAKDGGSQGTWKNAGNVYYYIGGSSNCPTGTSKNASDSSKNDCTTRQDCSSQGGKAQCPSPAVSCPAPSTTCPTNPANCNSTGCGSTCGKTDCGVGGKACTAGTDCSKTSCGKDGKPCITETPAPQESAPAQETGTPAGNDTTAPVTTPEAPADTQETPVTDNGNGNAQSQAPAVENTPDSTEDADENSTEEAPVVDKNAANCVPSTLTINDSLYKCLVNLLNKCGLDAGKVTVITNLCKVKTPEAPAGGGNNTGTPSGNGGQNGGQSGTPSGNNGGAPSGSTGGSNNSGTTPSGSTGGSNNSGTTPGGSENGGNSSTKPEENVDNLSFEEQVVALVNQERAANGLAPLTLNTELSGVARAKSQDMHDNGYFSHTSPTYGSPFDMMKAFGISYRAAGENIAMGYRTPEAVMNGWMNSSGHRANILSSSFTQIGVGYVADGHYWTQMFIG